MFIRRKQDWRQEYFYLVESVRDGAKVRQRSVYLGKSLNLSAVRWAEVLDEVGERLDFFIRPSTEDVRQAVRAYCKKHGLPMKTAEAVRDGARLNRKLDEEETRRRKAENEARSRAWDEQYRRMWERDQQRKAGHYTSVDSSAKVLGVSTCATKEEIQAAFRKQAAVCHPDHGGDAEKFIAVTAARDAMLRHLGTTA
jgi:DnaJ domain